MDRASFSDPVQRMRTIYVYVTSELTDNLFRAWSDFSEAERRIFHALLFQVKDKVREELGDTRDVQPGSFVATFGVAQMECVLTLLPEESEVTILVVRINFSDDGPDPDGDGGQPIDNGRHVIDRAVVRISDRQAVLLTFPRYPGRDRKSQLLAGAAIGDESASSITQSSNIDKHIQSIFLRKNMNKRVANKLVARASILSDGGGGLNELSECYAYYSALYGLCPEGLPWFSAIKAGVLLPRLIDLGLATLEQSEKMKRYASKVPPIRPLAGAGLVGKNCRLTVFASDNFADMRVPGMYESLTALSPARQVSRGAHFERECASEVDATTAYSAKFYECVSEITNAQPCCGQSKNSRVPRSDSSLECDRNIYPESARSCCLPEWHFPSDNHCKHGV